MPHNGKTNIMVGDLVVTHNKLLGKVVRLGRDGFGDYIIVMFDIIKGEFAYDPWDLEKISDV